MSVIDLKTRLTKIEHIINNIFGDNSPPGFALGVVYKDTSAFEWHHGYANLQAMQPVTSDTVFRIGSISKTFTALAVMQLWEKGCFALDDPVNDYLKSFNIHPPSSDAPTITIHHLLTHISGLGRGETMRELVDVYGHFTGRWETRFKTLNELYMPYGLHPMIPAGEKYSYSNNGYAVLGQLIEDVSGVPFAEYIRQNVFTPLEMTASDVVISENIRLAMACGYRGKAGQYTPIRPTEIRQQGAGALMSSLKDMMTFLHAILRRDEQPLREDTWKMMLQPHWQLDPRLWADSYGIQFYNLAGSRIYNQAGGAGGFNANITFSPDHHLGLVALSNRTLTIETYRATRKIMRCLLDIAPDETEHDARDTISHDRQLEAFTGYYAPSSGWKTNIDFYTDIGIAGVHIIVDSGRLKLRTDFGRLTEGIYLYPDADDPMLFHGQLGSWSPFIFHRDETGQIDGLMFDFHHSLYRCPVSHSLKNRLKRFLWWSLAGTILLIGFLRGRLKHITD